ncbi:MAG: hypothetical protein WA979_13865, partial [Pacificimonas sp.]
MSLAIFLAAQSLPLSPIPPQMESLISSYSQCIYDGFEASISKNTLAEDHVSVPDGPTLINDAIQGCVE